MRGNPLLLSRGFCPARSIPACAGEPQRCPTQILTHRVYPRVCGGTVIVCLLVPGVLGLSPRVRGNLFEPRLKNQSAGSIPACAGEPHRRPRPGADQAVYPRVCGGTSFSDILSLMPGGLSPRVRGNLDADRRRVFPERSIPACAGEPSGRATSNSHVKVYPRVCGGTFAIPEFRQHGKGLSPRVRGNPAPGRPQSCPPGSIPACAGEPHVDSTLIR